MKTNPQFRTAYEPSKRVPFHTGSQTLTEQHHVEYTETYAILAQYDKTGLIDHVAKATASYGDYSDINEYQDALNLVLKSKESFAALPSNIRAEFRNDPGEFLEFATNPANAEAMQKMGLMSTPYRPNVEKSTPSDTKNSTEEK